MKALIFARIKALRGVSYPNIGATYPVICFYY
jgi:hypothetical protein